MKEINERFWLRVSGLSWQEATQEQFVEAERRAGFRPKSGSGIATGGFYSGAVVGRVTLGEITLENYGRDPEFLTAVAARERQKEALQKLLSLRPASGTDLNFDYERGVLKD